MRNLIYEKCNSRMVKYEMIKSYSELVRVNKIYLSNKYTKDSEDEYLEIQNGIYNILNSMVLNKEAISFYINNEVGQGLEILFESSEKSEIRSLLHSGFAGASLESIKKEKVFRYIGIINCDMKSQETIKSNKRMLIKTMLESECCLKIASYPINESDLDYIYYKLIEQRNKIGKEIKRAITETRTTGKSSSSRSGESTTNNLGGSAVFFNKQEGTSTSADKTDSNNESISKGINYEKINNEVLEIDKFLEENIEKILHLKRKGAFKSNIIIGANKKEDLSRLISSCTCLFGEDSESKIYSTFIEEKINIFDEFKFRNLNNTNSIISERIGQAYNLYGITELSKLLTLNFDEVNGFSIKKTPEFSQQYKSLSDNHMGEFLRFKEKTGVKFNITEEDINKHILVAGTTGSGKTNTIFSLLDKFEKSFLVIEPAKTEYRVLKSKIKNLRIYTLGKENISPFRFNPFKFDYKNISIQEHIDNVKVIFTAAFTMYASMPNILEQSLYNVYIKKGWSILTSKNIFNDDDAIMNDYFPTIEDLYFELDNYIESLGYALEQKQNIKAALLTRIKSLMMGSKGYMFNTKKSIDVTDLLKYPTILELEGISDDEEKALMIGFIMLSIYEYLRANVKGYNAKLEHIVVIEEAHRLFSNISSSGNQETNNSKGKAVETLSNILCEIRAYGEGFIIVDQVPTKLAKDVLKNTNTKIIHKLVSKEDIDYISSSLDINEEDSRYIATLGVGETLILNESLEGVANIQINISKDNYTYIDNKELEVLALEFNKFKYDKHLNHPIGEIMLNYDAVKNRVYEVTREYINNITQGDIRSLEESYYKSYKKYLNISEEIGFCIERDKKQLVEFLILKCSEEILNKSKISNNVKAKNKILNYIYRVTDLINNKEILDNQKVLKLVEINRRDLYLRGI